MVQEKYIDMSDPSKLDTFLEIIHPDFREQLLNDCKWYEK
jgi:hypothetical protein